MVADFRIWWSASVDDHLFVNHARFYCARSGDYYAELPEDAVLMVPENRVFSVYEGWSVTRCPGCKCDIWAQDDAPEVGCPCGVTIRARMNEGTR